MEKFKFVIAGGGMVAGYAAKQLVESGLAAGDLAIISSDNFVPYERPPLSKGFLAGKDGEESIRISPDDFYRTHGIQLKLNTTISSIDADQSRLTLADGKSYEFNKLVIATGARPRKLQIPGADLAGVHYLRSLDDSKAIRQHAGSVKRAVVLGGGFIGMETAAVLSQKGIAVTMILKEERIWKQFFTPQMSGFFEGYYQSRGVRFVKNVAVTELRGEAV
jgi:3-phenylpropionate/trans-cinnamate dioxygenase ferredoxin reductase subunit